MWVRLLHRAVSVYAIYTRLCGNSFSQRTPWGGGRGWKTSRMTPLPKRGFWTRRTVRFPPPSGVTPLFFLYKNPWQSRPEALLEGSKNFRESAFSGTFSSPHTFCSPPYHGPIFNCTHICYTKDLFPNYLCTIGPNIFAAQKKHLWGRYSFRKGITKIALKNPWYVRFPWKDLQKWHLKLWNSRKNNKIDNYKIISGDELPCPSFPCLFWFQQENHHFYQGLSSLSSALKPWKNKRGSHFGPHSKLGALLHALVLCNWGCLLCCDPEQGSAESRWSVIRWRSLARVSRWSSSKLRCLRPALPPTEPQITLTLQPLLFLEVKELGP